MELHLHSPYMFMTQCINNCLKSSGSNSGWWGQLGPLGTTARNRPIVPAPGDYDDGDIGGMIGRGNRSTRRKPAQVPICSPQTPYALPGREPGPPRWEASD
jgi:hypothetical protein